MVRMRVGHQDREQRLVQRPQTCAQGLDVGDEQVGVDHHYSRLSLDQVGVDAQAGFGGAVGMDDRSGHAGSSAECAAPRRRRLLRDFLPQHTTASKTSCYAIWLWMLIPSACAGQPGLARYGPKVKLDERRLRIVAAGLVGQAAASSSATASVSWRMSDDAVPCIASATISAALVELWTPDSPLCRFVHRRACARPTRSAKITSWAAGRSTSPANVRYSSLPAAYRTSRSPAILETSKTATGMAKATEMALHR